ncbi:MAG TPA: hypothetical protein VEA37_06955 [Flavobacterium sp.]|nr:hypothetical protein [Flavobacterium sp.]
MDLGYLKIKIDIKTEHDEFKKRYEYKKKELKKDEIKKVFDGFKEFFKSDGNFKFKENEHSIIAEYKDHGIKLEMDIYKNIDAAGFNLDGTITTYEKECYGFMVEGRCNKELTLQPPEVDEQERMVHDTRFYKDFLDDEITYSFIFKINGREEEYPSMQELMLAL